MVLDRPLVAAGDEDHLAHAGGVGLLDRVLDQRLVDDRQHLLGLGLGRGQEAGAEAGHRKDRFVERHFWSFSYWYNVSAVCKILARTVASAGKRTPPVDLLVIDPIDAEVHALARRRAIRLRFAPELAFAPRELRRALYNVRAADHAASVALDAAVARLRAGAAGGRPRQRRHREHRPRGLRAAPASRSCAADRERPRRGRVRDRRACCRCCAACRSRAADGSVAGRELGGATIGLVGMPPAARTIAQLLAAFGVQHPRLRPGAARHRRRLGRLAASADAACASSSSAPTSLCVQLTTSAATTACSATGSCRHCKPNQVVVEHRRTRRLFDEAALAHGAEERPHRRGLARQRRAGRARPAIGRCTASRPCR